MALSIFKDALKEAFDVFCGNLEESFLAARDIVEHTRAEWARIRGAWSTKRHAMPPAQAWAIIGEENNEPGKLETRRDQLLYQTALSPYLQRRVKDAYNVCRASIGY
ncbi:Pam16 [Giardia muris]|uniref:Pam16 n=1 Tax=Giardia muris TaxID=5742 RepID=A0A4Z1T2X8_GIAMU|nr:Pam16 [Giardia muris]|eukprot:TNJ30008.1 Pam16 [Giardia muris]